MMSIIRLVAVTSICLGLALVSFTTFVADADPVFDDAHPDYAAFAARFAQIDHALNAGQGRAIVDLAQLNGGAWRTACLFGGYAHPLEQMERLGASIDQADRDRFGKPIGFRAGPVEETEAMIAFVDEEGRARFIHFRNGMGQHTQHYRQCVTKPETTLIVSG